jgi:hypothetical protein
MTPEIISAVSPDSKYTGAWYIQLGLCPVTLAVWYADGNNVGPQKSFAAIREPGVPKRKEKKERKKKFG